MTPLEGRSTLASWRNAKNGCCGGRTPPTRSSPSTSPGPEPCAAGPQEQASAAVAPYLGTRLSNASFSSIERSIAGARVKQFSADELIAFSRGFDLPIGWFFLPPPPEQDAGLHAADATWRGVDMSVLLDAVLGTDSSTPPLAPSATRLCRRYRQRPSGQHRHRRGHSRDRRKPSRSARRAESRRRASQEPSATSPKHAPSCCAWPNSWTASTPMATSRKHPTPNPQPDTDRRA